MKRLFLLLVLSSVLFYSCADRAPQRVAQQFLQLYYVENDFAAVLDVVTESSRENLLQTALLFEFDPNIRLDLFQSAELTDIRVDNDVAIGYYRVDEINRQLLLRRVNRQWLVDMSPETLQRGVEFSKSVSRPGGSGGFASAESDLTRVGDVPERRR